MEDNVNLYEQGLEEFPVSDVILGNLMMILQIALGTIAGWFVYPIAALIYLVTAVSMVYIVLRWMVCTHCYYYGKRCALGWGKLSALFFKKKNITQFSTCTGIKIAPFFYPLLAIIPLIFATVALIQELTPMRIAILTLLLFISIYSGAISRKKVCANCKMRLICPGSAAKG